MPVIRKKVAYVYRPVVVVVVLFLVSSVCSHKRLFVSLNDLIIKVMGRRAGCRRQGHVTLAQDSRISNPHRH